MKHQRNYKVKEKPNLTPYINSSKKSIFKSIPKAIFKEEKVEKKTVEENTKNLQHPQETEEKDETEVCPVKL